MPGETMSISLILVGEDLDAERALSSLQADLEAASQLSVRRIIAPGGARPSGAKGLFQDITLLVTVSVPALSIFASVVRAWIKSKETRSLKLKVGKDSIELSGPWSEVQDRALNDFLARHGNTTPADSNSTASKKRRRHGRT